MSQNYDHKAIEEKWQKTWEEQGLFQDTAKREARDKFYILYAFAYPSGSGLHVGHVEPKTALDILARYYRMQGKDVFFPVGWDAFGLPAENFAIKTGTPPAVTTKNAIDTFRRQIKRIGISYDWANEIATNHPEYYKWTQWIFLQLYNKGLAYKSMGKVNWCPSCQTVLANEQVVEGVCERCGTQVIQKDLDQWYFAITRYQDQLIDDLALVDWPKSTIEQQKHWVGRQKGVKIDFQIKGWSNSEQFTDRNIISCFTTRIDTVFGVTFIVVSPEMIGDLKARGLWEPDREVNNYLILAAQKTEEERRIGERDKTGVNTGLVAINPVNGEEVPIFVADYVLSGYGTGVVMGVPAHDKRDWDFAKKFNLNIRPVVLPKKTEHVTAEYIEDIQSGKICESIAMGNLINSGEFTGMDCQEAMDKIPEKFPEVMQKSTTYKLRDWLISRQRYWGAPIPVVYDLEGKPHPVKEEHLPWTLPTDVEFKPTGESPLVHSKEFIERTERLYGKGWRPEFDTMDTFVDSSWYYLRYPSARSGQAAFEKEQLEKWLPVDFYMIGPEHIVLHLLYSRFFTKFLRDEGYLTFDEPFMKMRHQGMILGPDHRKMSKSKGNVIDPDGVIAEFGADTLRVYEMFMGPIEADKPWSTTSVAGVFRFLNRVWRLVGQAEPAEQTVPELAQKVHQTLKRVTEDIPALKFNTAIAGMMEMVNVWESQAEVKRSMSGEDLERVITMLAPFAPFLADELWANFGHEESVHTRVWPKYSEELAKGNSIIVVVQVNGKVRANLELATETDFSDQAAIEALARRDETMAKWLTDKEVRKVVWVGPKDGRQGLLNFVVV